MSTDLPYVYTEYKKVFIENLTYVKCASQITNCNIQYQI